MKARDEQKLWSRRRALELGMGLSFASVLACQKKPEVPRLGQLPDFDLVDQDGQRFSLSEARGKVWAASFMFTRCPSICPRITRRMHELQVIAISKNMPLFFLSISVDPENDTPEVLKKYGQKYGANFDSWKFLTGEFKAIRKTAEEGFKMAVEGQADPAREHYGIMHGSHLVLVDQRATIRGYYRTGEDEPLELILEDAQRVIAA